MKINRLFILLTFSIILILYSCKKMLVVDPPRNQLVTSIVFSDSTNANSALLGIYISIMNLSTSFNIANGGVTAYTGLSSDELYPTGGLPEEDEFYTNNISVNPGNYINATFWQAAYQFIYQANACIEGLGSAHSLSVSLKNKLIAEAKFMRAYLYFNLINLFGDVPYVTSTDFHHNATLPRTSTTTIYTQIIEDLKSAESMLPEAGASSLRIRPNKIAATALLARIFLYLNKYNESEQAASVVINSSFYALEPSLNNVFLPKSKETIWQMMPVQPGYNTPEGQLFIPTPAGRPRYGVTGYLLNDFDTGDMRKLSWLKSKTVSSILYTYPFKYKLRFDGSATPSEYYVVLRLAEQYLIRAEARAKLNNLDGARMDLNMIRSRAGLANFAGNSQAEILAAIDHEKRIEFFCEEGHRWFDLIRHDKANLILSVIKAPNWQATDQLYPVPFAELQYNPFLVQNPGY